MSYVSLGQLGRWPLNLRGSNLLANASGSRRAAKAKARAAAKESAIADRDLNIAKAQADEAAIMQAEAAKAQADALAQQARQAAEDAAAVEDMFADEADSAAAGDGFQDTFSQEEGGPGPSERQEEKPFPWLLVGGAGLAALLLLRR